MALDITKLEALLRTKANELVELFIQTMSLTIPATRVKSGSWSNTSGLVTAYVSYQLSDNPAEDTLEVVYSLSPVQDGLQFSVDICQPDGEVLAAITDSYVAFSNEDELIGELNQLCDIAGKGALSRLKAMLLPT